MPINFPNSPSSGQLYTYDNKTWEFNGVYWEVYSALTSYITSAYTVGDGFSDISGVTGGNIALKSFSGVNISIIDSGNKLTFSASTTSPSVSGDYLPLSGGTVTGATNFTAGLTANTISATTYQNLPVSALTEGNNISVSGSNGNFTISFTGTTGSNFTGGTVTGATIFTNGLTANTFSATTITATQYNNLPLDVFVTGGTYASGSITFSNNSGGTFTVSGLPIGGQGGQVYYFNTSVNQTPYKEFGPTGTSASEQSTTISVASGVTSTIQSYLTPVGYPNSILIPGGVWSFYLHTYKEDINSSFDVYCDVYLSTSGGTDTYLFSTDPFDVTSIASTPSMGISDGYFSGKTINTSDRILVLVKATNTGTSTKNITFVTEGSVHYSYGITTFTNLPANVSSLNATDGVSASSTTGAVTIINTDKGSSQNIFKNIQIGGITQFTSNSNTANLNFSGVNISIFSSSTNTLVFSSSTSSSGGLSYYITGATPSATINNGDRWFNTNTGIELVYINDGDSSQWIQPNGGTGTFTGNTSANCISQLYVTNVYGCSPINFNDPINLKSGATFSGTVTFNGPVNLNSGFTSNSIIVTAATVNGNLTVTGNTSLLGLTATTISATTYQNLPIKYYAEFSGAPSTSPIVLGTDSISIGNGAESRSTFMLSFGTNAGKNATNTTVSNFIGGGAGYDASGSTYVNFIGSNAGYGAINANSSTFLNAASGNFSTGATYSNFFGTSAGESSKDLNYSNVLGYQAGLGVTNAQNVNYFGRQSGWNATNATFSNFIGFGAGTSATNASYSNFIGSNAGTQASSASFSNLIGFNAGKLFTGNNIGSNNIIIGTNISLPSGATNSINIGGVLFGTGTYSTTNTDPSIIPSNGKIGINVVSPITTLDVNGTTRITGGLTASSITSTGVTTLGSGTFTKGGSGPGDILLDNNSTDTPALLMYYANNTNWGIDSNNQSFGALSGQLLRFVGNLNEAGGVVRAAMDTTGNLVTNGFVLPNAWRAGQTILDTMLSNTEVTVSTTTIATSTSDTDFVTYSYTPLSSSSYLIIHYHLADYSFASGTGNDSYISRIKVDGSEITYSKQSTVNGNRSGVLFPLTGRYTNSSTAAKSIVVACRRDSADDNITIVNSSTSMWLRITEIGR